MAESKELKKRHQNPDPEMLKNMQLLSKIEILNMMREMGIVQEVQPTKPGEKEKKK